MVFFNTKSNRVEIKTSFKFEQFTLKRYHYYKVSKNNNIKKRILYVYKSV